MKTHLVCLGLGSNLDHPIHHVSCALQQLIQHAHMTLLAHSPFYVSAPIGPQNQPSFINAVAAIETSLTPFNLLAATQLMEKNQGRPAIHDHWGPRTLDIDILLYDDKTLHTETLVIPHPEMHHRPFVMEPLQNVIAQLSLKDAKNAKLLRQNLLFLRTKSHQSCGEEDATAYFS
ncbi:MAG: 2-amino-4-hydroxy-6-hydroxymethyldihydropteridine diphosphokinase [Gammaproteobacteria bacterium]